MSRRLSRSTLTTWGCAVLLCASAAPCAAAQNPAHTTMTAVTADAQQDERTAIADRSRSALTTPAGFRLTAGGETLLSEPAPGTNYLGRDGSNANLNAYNNYNGLAWCGYFAAAMWDHRGTPANYPGSQSWRTDLGSRFHAYAPGELPETGDVLVWTDTGDSSHGHVGVVVEVDGTTVITVEGNTGDHSDSVSERNYTWYGAGPERAGKTFRGFASPF